MLQSFLILSFCLINQKRNLENFEQVEKENSSVSNVALSNILCAVAFTVRGVFAAEELSCVQDLSVLRVQLGSLNPAQGWWTASLRVKTTSYTT